MKKVKRIGQGTYGVVYTAVNDNDPEIELAVKRNIIDISTSFSGSLRELDLLTYLKGHPYIVNLMYVSFGNPFPMPNSPIRGEGHQYKEDYLYFIFEKAQKDLTSIIYETKTHISHLKLII